MPYTEKQLLVAKYMLQQLGMTDESIMEKYLRGLENAYGRFLYFPPNGQWYYSVQDCFNNIKEELALKKNKALIKSKQIDDNMFITATDFASYTFCPASYSIQKSFVIDKPSNVQSTVVGNSLHEKLRLIKNCIHQGKFENQEPEEDFIFNHPILRFIYASKILYSGHKEPNLIFVNHEEAFKGAPDYIFKAQNEVFVVEEKYIFKKDPNKASYEELKYDIHDEYAEEKREKWKNIQPFFYDSHKIQLISYIRNIKEYDIKYGFLIYWYYDYDNNNMPNIHKVSILKMNMDEHFEDIYQKSKKSILQLKLNNCQVFNPDYLNLFKCAACVVNKYCGHKTSTIDKLSYPYDKKDMLKIYIPFPDALKPPP